MRIRSRLLLAASAALILVLPGVPATARSFVHFIQPFALTFYRTDNQVITWFDNNPRYDALEAFVQHREGREPLIRVILTSHDGSQVDHLNDNQVAIERARTLGRKTFYTPMEFTESSVEGCPAISLRFKSFNGEDISWYFRAMFPASTAFGGLTDPGNHAISDSLPVMWREASTIGGTGNWVTINGQKAPLKPGEKPGTCKALFTTNFLIGVMRAAHIEYTLVDGPGSLRPGEKWVYQDQNGKSSEYRIVERNGRQVVIQKTTGQEEIITARIAGEQLLIEKVRVTGRVAGDRNIPPDPMGFTLALSDEGRFSISIDGRENPITGNAETTTRKGGSLTAFRLTPSEPRWALLRKARVTASWQGNRVVVDNAFGE